MFFFVLQEIDPQVQNKQDDIEDMSQSDEDGKTAL